MTTRAAALPLILSVTVLAGTVLAACAGPAPATTPTSSATSAQTPTAEPSETAAPDAAVGLVLSLDGVTVSMADGSESIDLSQGDAMIALLTDVAGAEPTIERLPPWEGMDLRLTRYSWDGLWLTQHDDGAVMGLSATGPTLNGVPVTTAEGIGVGASKADLLAAGAWSQSQDGSEELFGLGSREVPGTNSLARPGSVGIEYMLVIVEGDQVVQLRAPANDYADI